MYEIQVQTSDHTEFIHIDRQVQAVVTKSGVTSGICHIYVPHTTAGLTIQENADPDVKRDMAVILDRIVPWSAGYAHTEGNSAAHVKASMMGFSQTVLIEDGQLAFGTWQSIYFCEFDGPRQRTVWIKIVPTA